MSAFDSLPARPADALLGLLAAFRADPREDKVDLGVGIYRNESGATPVMAAVKAAEAKLVEATETKAYEGPRGNAAFCDAIERFVLGERPDGGIGSFATPGGCGALGLAMPLLKRLDAATTLWMSKPTWPNHPHIAANAALMVDDYTYRGLSSGSGVDVDAMKVDLEAARRGDAVLLQGPCHNPTGIDLTTEQWDEIGGFCAARGLIPLVDIAYHGFDVPPEAGMEGVQRLVSHVPDALISYSCSKNFGLYRDRAGALLIKTDNDKALHSVSSHVADIARATYSMPPAHGPAIVATILGDEALRSQWLQELAKMRERMKELRANLAAALTPRSNSYDPKVLISQNGMFSQLPFTEGGVEALREKGVYIPGSGRINVAGLTTAIIPQVAETLSPYL